MDDDPQTLRFVRDALAEAGYAPLVTGEPKDLPRILRAERPRLVLLDLMLPDVDGIELMGRIPELSDLPVIFISAYGRDETIARALEAGAADYIVKPFSPTELVARVRAALRRHERPEAFALGDLAIDYERRRASLGGAPSKLTATEFDLLRVLSLHGRAGGVLRHAAAAGLGQERTGHDERGARVRPEPAPQARRRRGQPSLHLQRARHRLPHGETAGPLRTQRTRGE